MTVWQMVLIVVLSVVVGIPVYCFMGFRVAKYIIAIVGGCGECLACGSKFSEVYNNVINDYPWWLGLMWPITLGATVMYLGLSLMVAALRLIWRLFVLWIKLIKYCLGKSSKK